MPMTCLPDQILRDPSAIHVPFVSAWKLSRPAECFRRLTFLSSSAALFAFFGEISFFLVFFRAGVLESAFGGEFGSVNDKNSVGALLLCQRSAGTSKTNTNTFFWSRSKSWRRAAPEPKIPWMTNLLFCPCHGGGDALK